ncbi:hypothetical protein [Aestuariibaculum marinum]|uniref:Uncharacterized protein n=1 Tax=Aestuariibaculum marinum TaxID=2683592 RepID=A0A8J6U163_9FLAO|nr:hypothetical protein [Aestuariibaculum marinum]MBD0822610.1 hypothetical protein [Aestuariibaculum marinum]
MKIEIKKTNGRWTLNGKQYHELENLEKTFMDGFFKHLKTNTINQIPYNHENN